MTPLQIAIEHCANYRGGRCTGMGINDDGSLFRFRSEGKCEIGIPGVRCSYFEECVAPFRPDDLKVRAEHEAAVREYRRAANVPKPNQNVRVCPVCNKRELEYRKKRCYACQEEFEKQANRIKNQKRRV